MSSGRERIVLYREFMLPVDYYTFIESVHSATGQIVRWSYKRCVSATQVSRVQGVEISDLSLRRYAEFLIFSVSFSRISDALKLGNNPFYFVRSLHLFATIYCVELTFLAFNITSILA